MELTGERITTTKWIEGDTFALRVRVEAIIPIEDPTEHCYEPQTLRHLSHLQELANAGDIETLSNYGDIFVIKSA